MRESHFFAGPLSSVPRTLPALRGTISWNLGSERKRWTLKRDRQDGMTDETPGEREKIVKRNQKRRHNDEIVRERLPMKNVGH